jgi:hypothetical protein
LSQQFVVLYIHELRMTAMPTTNSPPKVNGTAATISVSEFTDCLTATHNSLDAFLSLEMSLIRTLPTSYFVRITHTAILLVKLHFAVAGLQNHGDANIKAGDYLRRLVNKFIGWGTLWPAQKLAHTFRRLREMLRQRGNEGLASELAWLNVWTLEEVPSVESFGQTSRITTHAGSDGEVVRNSQSLGSAERATLSTFDQELLAWSLSGAGQCNVTQNTAHTAPPSTSLDATQLVDWFGTDLDTSTFDFDGNLQFMTQCFD